MYNAMFYFIAACTCVFAVLAVTQRNIFHCALWLAMMLWSIAGIYFYLGAPFLGVIQILVYVGGIVTLFIFTIMLTARIEDKAIRQTKQLWPSALTVFILFGIFFKVILKGPWAKAEFKDVTMSIEGIGRALMTQYVVPFEFMGVILLAAMVGAIVIGKTGQSSQPQNPSKEAKIP